MVHLLHVACSLKCLPANALSELLLELNNLGLLSDRARELAVLQPSEFKNVFDSTFEHHKVLTRFPTFWNSSGNIDPSSRFQSDFTRVRFLGKGGFGSVVLCKNKLDGREYAVKKVRLSSNVEKNEKILRLGWRLIILVTKKNRNLMRTSVVVGAVLQMRASMVLILQMAVCRHICIFKWNIVRAKVLRAEQTESDCSSSKTAGCEISSGSAIAHTTPEIGAIAYTAPEIDAKNSEIDGKVDIFSLGLVYFELMNHFRTGSERIQALTDLKKKYKLPSSWVQEYPEEASLVLRLTSQRPGNRPTAAELVAELMAVW